MDPIAKNVVPIRIQEEMRNSYMDYSMSVIIGRALPDVRDGLKPVHRRILYAMHREGLGASKRYVKCAGVVGEVLKRYHPHGDSAVYDALVRMAQPWNLRYMLVDGQGNFGSVDGDAAAHYRYTECRMTRLAEELLVDIDKETVDFSPNFDNTTEEPDVLPSRFPNLLVNGADGIAVGMATKIPPHNLGEVIDACVALIENPALGIDDLIRYIPGPDFPTGATIYGRNGVWEAYATGRGRVVVRGKARFEDLPGGRRAIVVDEIPYQVNKARLIEQIAELVRDKRLEGVHALRDESDRQGMRIVVELKMDAFEEIVLNHLYKHTALQSTFGVIMLAIVDQRPRVLNLREMLQLYVTHRRDVILRRTRYELRKARERAHILEGLRIALDHVDEVIALIRASADGDAARTALMHGFGLSELQAQAILDMRLQRLTGLERQKVEDEYAEVQARILELSAILASDERLMGVVKQELLDVKAAYADPRRTDFSDDEGELSIRDLVAEEDQVVTVSRLGYIKRCPPTEWRMQKRGGTGKMGMATRDEDFVTSLFIANTHSLLMVFTSGGKVFPLEVHAVPEAGRNAKGRPIVNLVPVPETETITAVVAVKDSDWDTKAELLFVSREGYIKRTPLADFGNIRQGGLIAAGVDEGDALTVVRLVDPDADLDVMIFGANGRFVRFPLGGEKGTRVYGRNARGRIGIRLRAGVAVVDALLVPARHVEPEGEEAEEEIPALQVEPADEEEIEEEVEGDALAETSPAEEPDVTLLIVTAGGFGKRTRLDAWPSGGRAKRGGSGIFAYKVGDETRHVVAALQVHRDDQLMVVTDSGRVIRFGASEVRFVKGRAAQGVKLMRLDEGESVVDVARLEDVEEAEGADSEEAEGADSDEGTADAGAPSDDGGPADDSGEVGEE